MRFRYPRSFSTLLAAGFLLTTLPLALGLLSNNWAISRLAEQSRRSVQETARVAHATRELVDAVPSMQRAAQQMLVLRDPSLLAGYTNWRSKFSTAGSRLQAMPMAAAMQAELREMLTEEQRLHTVFLAYMEQPTTAYDAAAAADGYAKVRDIAQTLLRRSHAAVDREADALSELAAQTEQRERLQFALTLPLATLLVLGFIRLLVRPIRQMGLAIRGLGEGGFDARIEIDGPEDLQQLGRQLDWLRLRLVQMEEQKSRFLRQIAHELKTPLSALREGSDLLAEGVIGPLSDSQNEVVHIIQENSLHLQRLIENLLRHGEADFRQAPLKLQSIQPAEVIAAVLDKHRLAIAGRALTIDLTGGEFVMQTDVERLRTIVDNLLSNAIKFSPQGGCVRIAAQAGSGRAVIEVTDDGPGVAREDRERICDPFYRGRHQAQGALKGTGLGLSITKEHVLALGGSLVVGEDLGQFTVTLPLGEP